MRRFWLAPVFCLWLAVGVRGAAAQPVAGKAITQASQGSSPRLVLTEAWKVGSAEGENDSFGRVMDATLDRSGRLLVADDLNHRVAVFDARGRFVRFLGRRGRGPGEMESPWLVAADARDSVFVWDNALSRISVFGPDLAFRRSFAVPPHWLGNSLRFLPDGRLLVAAYGRGDPAGLHVVRRDGTVERTFGPAPETRDLAGFEASLLGGNVDVAEGTIVYSVKSPYDLWFFDMAGRTTARCTGRRDWTTDPADVVRTGDAGAALQWMRYVHSYNVVALGGGLYLNQVLDPAGDRTVLDLVTSDCRLLRRTTVDVPVTLMAGSGSRLVAVRNPEFPEVVVFERRIVR